ncbi:MULTISPECIES: phosphoribosylglycinamide formyltransferase [unclassified Cellulophaga]|uniref:phosphoribosylglycinamide formyltransferase n=1 Tax=unclassified Cellulophaga TaxID=2634405 RepID=UPI0026E2718D|nr:MULTISPECIES: phosphoribosylglycinamide formyltransferase [unclassified Cellulophaga]MDO6491290.1 phosphoribosylglycinamide formyltransferase [Cellulophaga sp. 2_MG-2023]MDO6495177.1 phosphoribosylglycinamide formyltransferase [Cellulophaga sp. 3_MG-2023]
MKRIVLLASGSGSNVENIANYFKDNPLVTIICVLTNKRDAKVIDRCNRLNISSLYFNREAFSKSDCLLDIIKGMQPDLIILAGFLLKIPQKFVDAFPNKIVNIHPALLPNYGGKGMYGMHVHNAVKNNNESKTGITIHYVNENYDEGAIIYQAETAVNSNDSVDDIAKKVHMLEYEHFPKVIDQLLSK